MKTILICIFLLSQTLLAADEQGVFMVVKGKVKIENPKSSAEAKVGSKVFEGDTVVTETDSRAKIVMMDRNIINISPNTKLKIEKYSNTPKDKNVRLNLIEGKVRNNVEQKYDNKSSKFEVRTATAVAGVRGTQFITSYNSKTKVTEVVTLKGQVSFQSMNVQGNTPVSEPVMINKGEKSEAKEGGAVAPPVKVPTQEMKQMETETNIKKDPPKGSPSEGGDDGGKKPPQVKAPDADRGSPAPMAGNPLKDMTKDNNQIIDGATTRKFDKSKVKIITQPGN